METRIEYYDDILKLFVLYLEKYENLTEREREAFCDYFNYLSHPRITVDTKFNIDDLMSNN